MDKFRKSKWSTKIKLVVPNGTCSECGGSYPKDELNGGVCYFCRMEKNYPPTR